MTALLSLPPANPFYAARRSRPTDAIPAIPTGYARLPQVPRTASPVPELTSLWHDPDPGPWGDRAYPGNCSGSIIHALLRYYAPTRVYDPMTGSGTCRDVCRDLSIECRSADIHEGADACDPPAERDAFDFVWLHPPYWRQKLYAADPRDLSRESTLDGFVPLVYHTKRLAFDAGLRQCATDIVRFGHGASSGRKTYRSRFIPGLHDICVIFQKPEAGAPR